jgi:hypothetical protein
MTMTSYRDRVDAGRIASREAVSFCTAAHVARDVHHMRVEYTRSSPLRATLNPGCAMSYTLRSLVFLWLITSALFAVSVSAAPAGWWLVLLLAVALATPFLVLRNQAAVTDNTSERPSIPAGRRESSPLALDGTDVFRWENEGGARPTRPLTA